LSGGQQQRVAIARCLVLEPAVLLLDEPLGALDLKLREQMKIQLKHLQREVGTTFVYVTHDQSEALVMSDWVAVMNEGRVLQIGRPDEIYNHPANPFVASFVGESNRLQGLVTRVSEEYAVLKVDPLEVKIPLHPDMKVGEPFLLFIRPEKVRLMPSDAVEAGLNQFNGIIKEVIFEGAVARCVVDIGYGHSMTAMVTRSSDAHLPREGELARVTWSVKDCICFPARLFVAARSNSGELSSSAP